MFFKSGRIQRAVISVMRLLQLVWLLCVAALLVILILQLLCGAIGYGITGFGPMSSEMASSLMTVILIAYPTFFILRAVLLEFAKEYITVRDLLDHLKAQRLFCFMLIAFFGKKPAYQAALALYVVGIEYKIANISRIFNVRKQYNLCE